MQRGLRFESCLLEFVMAKFTHFFQSHPKKPDDSRSQDEIYALKSAQELLSSTQHQRYITFIKKYARAPQEYFDALYLPLIESFAEITQTILENTGKETPDANPLLTNGLLRGAYALLLRHGMFVPENPSDKDLAEDYGLWTYVIFSSALFWKTSRLITHYEILLSLGDLKTSSPWHPLLGTPLAQGKTHYHYQNRTLDACIDEPTYSVMLAKHYMPIEGFMWIASNPKALAYWMAALNEDGQAASSVGEVLSLADYLRLTQLQLASSQDMLGYVEAFLRGRLAEPVSIKKLTELVKSAEIIPPVSTTLEDSSNLGSEFLNWLRNGIANKSIQVNGPNAAVHMTNEGVFLLFPQIFIEFCKAFQKYASWVVVYKQFNTLGISKFDDNDTFFEKFFDSSPKHANKKVTGVMVGNPSLLFDKTNTPGVSAYIRNPVSRAGQTQYPSLQGQMEKPSIKGQY